MDERPSAEKIVRQLKQAGVEFVINVPDRMTAAIVDRAAQEPPMKSERY
jgi:sulfopyruvate decarboxylase TPP-binding subunit